MDIYSIMDYYLDTSIKAQKSDTLEIEHCSNPKFWNSLEK